MTPLKKIFVYSILVIVILTILREIGIIDFNHYKITSKTTCSNNWSDNGMTVTIDSSIMHTKFNNSLFRELSVVVLYNNDTIYQDKLNKRKPIIVNIDTLNNDFLFIPFYKTTAIRAIGTVTFKDEITKTPPTKIVLVKASLKGQLSLVGNITIVGLCSHKQSETSIKNLVADKFVEETKKYFSTLD